MDRVIQAEDLNDPSVGCHDPQPVRRCLPISAPLQEYPRPARALHHLRPKVDNLNRRGTLPASAVAFGEQGLQFAEFDTAYLERLQARDSRTEAHFVVYFSELIRLKLRSRLASKEATEDARQETFVRVLSLIRSDGLKQPERLGALVNSICNNVLMEQYRAKSRRESPLDDEMQGSFVDPEPSVLNAIETKEAERLVRQTLGDLAERDRGLLRSVMLEDRDKGEICAEYGVTREHLRVLVHRAKLTFKSYYLRRVGLL